jgi:hypothetical protein
MLTMRQLRRILRLHHEGASAREIVRALGVARRMGTRLSRLANLRGALTNQTARGPENPPSRSNLHRGNGSTRSATVEKTL